MDDERLSNIYNVDSIIAKDFHINNSTDNVKYPTNTSNCYILLPDAGYENADNFSATSQSTQQILFDSSLLHKNNERFVNVSQQSLTAKKPTSILKMSSVYSNESEIVKDSIRANTPTGFKSVKTWHSPKNVQMDSNKEGEEWESETENKNVFKELSYQYLKCPDSAETVIEQNQLELATSVQSMIKSFESVNTSENPIQEFLKMQKPLKISLSPATEAHVSRLESSKNEEVPITASEIPLIESQNIHETLKKSPPKIDRNKSVKDLLADFEKKSEQIKQENYKNVEIKHRGVFSDTETLLYDTESDLDQLDKSDEEKTDQILCSVLDITNEYTGTIRRNNDPLEERRKRKTSKATVCSDVLLKQHENTLKEYNGLSVSEYFLTNSDKQSSKIKTNNSSQKSIDVVTENHYLPMNPRKSILDPNCDSQLTPKMMNNLIENLSHEESSYVEMTQSGIAHSLLASNNENDEIHYGDYTDLDTPNYEFVSVENNKMEPVYMEVNQFKDDKMPSKIFKLKNTRSTNSITRSELPDILNTLKSDSSDADDESSKDLDSIDTPSHPRFSLSDTFRPASYYLGASRTLITEMQDSSDSELVSPPPIPTSPAPLDDLDSLELQQSINCKKDKLIKDNSFNEKNISDNKSFAEPQRLSPEFSESIHSMFNRNTLDNSSRSDFTEITNINDTIEYQLQKRKPVSDELCGALEILDQLKYQESGNSIVLDQYLEELRAKDDFNIDLYIKGLNYNNVCNKNTNSTHIVEKEPTNKDIIENLFLQDTRVKANSYSSLPSIRVSEILPCHQHSQSFTGDSHYENLENLSSQKKPKNMDIEKCHSKDYTSEMNTAKTSLQKKSDYLSEIHSVIFQNSNYVKHSPVMSSSCSINPVSTSTHIARHSRSASEDSVRYSLSPSYRSSSSQDFNQYDPNRTKNTPFHQSFNQHGAPYYYSDLQSSYQIQKNLKLHDISHSNNPIKYEHLLPLKLPQSLNKTNSVKKCSCEMKTNSNIDQIKKNTVSVESITSVTNDCKISDDQLKIMENVNQTSHRRSRSLEGLYDDFDLQNLKKVSAIQSTLNKSIENIKKNSKVSTHNAFKDENRWEQDTLWRESLRTFSLVHARSLDNIDSARRKNSLQQNNKTNLSESHENSKKKNKANLKLESHSETGHLGGDITGPTDVKNNESYGGLSIGANGYIWDSNKKMYYKIKNAAQKHFFLTGNLPPTRPISETRTSTLFELDREKLRQWDLLSSACLLQEQQRTSMAESVRRLPTFEATTEVEERTTLTKKTNQNGNCERKNQTSIQ